jgi:hypothetical protein
MEIGRTIDSYDTLGRLRVLCANSGHPVTGDIVVQTSNITQKSRWTRCPECNHSTRVTGLKSKPRLAVHIAVYQT